VSNAARRFDIAVELAMEAQRIHGTDDGEAVRLLD
jgi:hypothetical protein